MGAGIFLALPALASDIVLTVKVRNELPFARQSETVELTAAQLAPLGTDLRRIHVFADDHEVLAQSINLGDGSRPLLIFQTDIPAHGEQTFDIRGGEPRTYRKEDFRVYGRFVRERSDDFAWENDRIAHRMYGAALETWQQEPLTSSAVDVWLKRTHRLVVNDWYMVDDYHRDHGEGGDFYSAGSSRGCGGSGLWRDGKLVVSKNFRDSRVLAAGPIRLVFELTYPVWSAPGVRSEVKRITLDAGQNLSRFQSRYEVDGSTDGLQFATGLKEFPGTDLRIDKATGVMRTWGPVKGAAGHFGCAIVIDPTSIAGTAVADGNDVVIARAADGARASYYAGAAWDQSGDFNGVAEWDRYVDQWAQRTKAPLHIEVIPK